jgi:hypothetical protein
MDEHFGGHLATDPLSQESAKLRGNKQPSKPVVPMDLVTQKKPKNQFGIAPDIEPGRSSHAIKSPSQRLNQDHRRSLRRISWTVEIDLITRRSKVQILPPPPP